MRAKNADVQFDPVSFASKIMNGAIAGTIGVSLIYPLDLAKTRLQNQLTMKTTQRLYKNLFDCLYKVAKTEGITGCYKGIGVNLLLVNPEKAIKLAVNDQARQIMGGKGNILPLRYEILAGGIAGLCQVIVTTPMEMLKIQMQVSGKRDSSIHNTRSAPIVQSHPTTHNRHYHTEAGKIPAIDPATKVSPLTTKTHSALALTKDLLRTRGVTGIYRGLAATLLRDIPFSCIYFTVFSYCNFMGYSSSGEKPTTLHTFTSAISAGLVSSVTVTPCDVIKTRLQVLPRDGVEARYAGIRDCARQIYAHEGAAAFFKGAVPRMLVIAPLFGIAQAVYLFEISERILGINK